MVRWGLLPDLNVPYHQQNLQTILPGNMKKNREVLWWKKRSQRNSKLVKYQKCGRIRLTQINICFVFFANQGALSCWRIQFWPRLNREQAEGSVWVVAGCTWGSPTWRLKSDFMWYIANASSAEKLPPPHHCIYNTANTYKSEKQSRLAAAFCVRRTRHRPVRVGIGSQLR